MKNYFIWLDDERPIKNNYLRYNNKVNIYICRQGEDACVLLNKLKNEKVYISFDHDLSYGMTGYDVAKFIVENEIPIAGFTIHSMNPVGAENIKKLLIHYGYVNITKYSDILK